VPNGELPTASWTVTQPWRGVFGMLVCLGIAFAISFVWFHNIMDYTGLMANWAMCMVPIEVVIGVAWMGRYPAERLEQPWRGIALTLFMFVIGTIAFMFLFYVIGGGHSAAPMLGAFIIMAVIVTMFWVIAFGCWPFHKMSLPAKGLLTLMSSYLLLMAGFRLFNFDTVGIGAPPPPFVPGRVPLAVEGGLHPELAGINPGGPVTWDYGLVFFFIMIVFMFAFLTLGFWPFSKFKSLMVQPVMGLAIFLSCFVLALICYGIMIWGMDLAPMRVMIYFVCFAFGMLGIIFMWQMWPGRSWPQPRGGFINLLLAVVLAIIAFYGMRAFVAMLFGWDWFVLDSASGYLTAGPFGWFALATACLGLTFPAWAIYSPAWDFWPLPPTPGPPAH